MPLPCNRDLMKRYAQGEHGPIKSNSGTLAVNASGELLSYGTLIIRRDMRTRSFQVPPRDASLWTLTTNRHIQEAKAFLLAEGFTELTMNGAEPHE